MSADDTIAAAEKALRHVRLAARALNSRSVSLNIQAWLDRRKAARRHGAVFRGRWKSATIRAGSDFLGARQGVRNGLEQMNGNRMQFLQRAVLCWLLVAGAAGPGQAQDGHIAPAPSLVAPPAIPMAPQAPAQIPVLKPSDVFVPKCRDGRRVECRSTRRNSGQRRLHRAD
jgi:hypothetical protein